MTKTDESSPASILILDGDKHICSGNCVGMTSFLAEAFPSASIRRTAVTTGLDRNGSSSAAQIIVLRLAVALLTEDYLRQVRQTWREPILLVVACGDPDQQSNLALLSHTDLDDFCFCPFQPYDLVARITRCASTLHRKTNSADDPKSALHPPGLVGRSPKFVEALARVATFADLNANVLLQGETGTGKKLFARALHYTGARRNGPFVPLNCGAIPEQLFENELFGQLTDAYTNASSRDRGLIDEAAGGTLFLNQVDSLTPGSQVKLLRFLLDRQYRPLGSMESLAADVRVIAASNTSLQGKVEAKLFREDLFHRLNVLTVKIPALRERVDDIELLSQHFLALLARQYCRNPVRLDQRALRKLQSHEWPGNVRELETTLHRAFVLAESPVMSVTDIDLDGSAPPGDDSPVAFHDAKQKFVSQFETTYLRNLLAEHRGNVSRAAQAAGTARRSFQRLISKHKLMPEQFR